MQSRWTAPLALGLALAAAATAAASAGSGGLPVLAVIGGRVFVGEAQPAQRYHLRTPITFASAGPPAVTCRGVYTLSAGRGDGFDIACDDGVKLRGDLTMENMTSGYGDGQAANGKFGFTYGMALKPAVRRLAALTGAPLSVDAQGNLMMAPPASR